MRQDEFQFTPQLKLILFGNHKPSLRSVNEAIRARFHLLPYLVTIPENKRDKDFSEKLRAEHGGILAWAMEGCMAWQKETLNPPAAVQEATKTYLDAEDAIRNWIDDHLELERDAFTPTKDLLQYYRMWAEDSGERPLSEKQLGAMLEDHGFTMSRRRAEGKQRRGYVGLRISEAARTEMRAKAAVKEKTAAANGAAKDEEERAAKVDDDIERLKSTLAGFYANKVCHV